MEWLNYHHLYYFWTVARQGSIARACGMLNLSQPTISGQLRILEDSLGEKLFQKSGRGLVMTEVGQVVYRYADEIFGIGRELQDVLKGRPQTRPVRLLVGIADSLPKLLAYRILRPALEMATPVQLVCHEDTPEHLLAELAEHRLDVVISDTPVTSKIPVKAFNHLLGTSEIALFAAPKLAAQHRKNFPACLNHAPFLLPMEGTSLRRNLDQWFDANNITPKVVGEFKDAALMNTFGQAGAGIFPGPIAIDKEIRGQYRVVTMKRLESVTERFYAISIERRLKHVAVVTISETARVSLFGDH